MPRALRTSLVMAATGSARLLGACGLVTTGELAAILQKAEPEEHAVTVTTPERAVGADGSICSVNRGGDLSIGREFQIDVFSADTLPFVVETPQRSAIPGIGDEAYLGHEGNFYAQVGDGAVHVVNVQITDDVSTRSRPPPRRA